MRKFVRSLLIKILCFLMGFSLAWVVKEYRHNQEFDRAWEITRENKKEVDKLEDAEEYRNRLRFLLEQQMKEVDYMLKFNKEAVVEATESEEEGR